MFSPVLYTNGHKKINSISWQKLEIIQKITSLIAVASQLSILKIRFYHICSDSTFPEFGQKCISAIVTLWPCPFMSLSEKCQKSVARQKVKIPAHNIFAKFESG